LIRCTVQIGQRVRFRVHRPGGEEPPCPVFVPAEACVMDGLKRGSVAIVGVAESDLGQVADGFSVIDLMAQGVQRALDDCGLQLKDVDGVFAATTQSRLSVLALCEYLGLNPPFLGSTIVGGSSFEYHVAHAMSAIQQGLCSVAVIAYGSTQRSVGRKQASVREINPYESPFKPFMPSSAYALAASRHMHQFGTTREQMAAVAVAAREWALLNPAAWEKKPLTIESVLSARMVSYPFTVRDCCLVTDGGGAVIVTSAERAKSLKKKPAYVLGCGQSVTHSAISSMPDLTVTGALASGKAAYKMAKLGPRRRRRMGALRRLHDQHDPVPRGPGRVQEGRGRGLRERWAHCA
jgi:acetyl-CoA acetyltransferase